MASKVRRRTPEYRAKGVVRKTHTEFEGLERLRHTGDMRLSSFARGVDRGERRMWERIYSQAVAQTAAEMGLDKGKRDYLHGWTRRYADKLAMVVSRLETAGVGDEIEFVQRIEMPNEGNPLAPEERTEFRGRYVENLRKIMNATLGEMKGRNKGN